METPPNTGPHRLNYMHLPRRGEDDEVRDAHSKFGPSTSFIKVEYHFSKKEPIAYTAER